MKVLEVRPVPGSVGYDLQVTFDREGWEWTTEGIRALRVFKLYGSPAQPKGRVLTVHFAGGKREINTFEACQAELDRWANHRLRLEFEHHVGSPVVSRPLKDMAEVTAALGFGYSVTAAVAITASLPIINHDWATLQSAYGNALVQNTVGNHPCWMRIFHKIESGQDPWKILRKLEADIRDIIK